MKARLPQGVGGGPGNMQSMLRQAQKMQEDMAKAQEELEQSEYTATVGGGAVTAVVDGKHMVKSLTIKPEVIDPDDAEMLADLIMGAVNEANRQAAEASEAKMSGIAGGMNIPGMPGLF
ncbi:MAG: YbaB/EbfC family nucleoid-associated protein [Acutalibacteraceae bacterium]|jgi:DNA-binding YbaB/EbfC family protein